MQTIEQMMTTGGATEKEAKQAIKIWELLEPCLKIRDNGRVRLKFKARGRDGTEISDKTPLGLLRSIVNAMEIE